MKKLSVALATFNEEGNIKRCLDSVKDIADEIIVVDGSSTDRTVEIAREFGAEVLIRENPEMFHINKQKAIDLATKDWVLQLDADEYVSKSLGEEVKKIINMNDEDILEYEEKTPKLFRRHQAILEKRDGPLGQEDKPYSAFFFPRANYFLGRYLKYGGVYPDGVIRLFKKDKAFLPCKDVHEQYVVDGRVGWLRNDLLHYDSPTFRKYIKRNNRYTSFIASQYKSEKLSKNPIVGINYIIIKPVYWFLLTFLRHKGFKDSWQGFLFSFFSSLRFPISYIKYLSR
ncbi:MAG: glycosyl transferase family protein [uncultured bacterium]|nr:MAG: glycosyl transferase family protein [uncultured bacterium]